MEGLLQERGSRRSKEELLVAWCCGVTKGAQGLLGNSAGLLVAQPRRRRPAIKEALLLCAWPGAVGSQGEEADQVLLVLDLVGGAAGLEMRSGLGRRRPAFRGGDGD